MILSTQEKVIYDFSNFPKVFTGCPLQKVHFVEYLNVKIKSKLGWVGAPWQGLLSKIYLLNFVKLIFLTTTKLSKLIFFLSTQ
jgi:hypothetical protein